MERGPDPLSVREELTQLEAHLDVARVSGDVAALGNVLAEEFRAVSPVGDVSGRGPMLRDFEAGIFKVRSSRSTDLEVRSYGETAVVSGTAHLAASHAGHDVSGTYAYTHVYVKRDGRWQVVAAHSSRVMPKALFFLASGLARISGR